MAGRLGNFVSHFGRTSSDTSDVNYERKVYHRGSLSLPEGLSSLHRDIDNLISENDEDQAFLGKFGSGVDTNKNLLRIKRTHWKDKSKINYCRKCSKAFGFASKKYNCRRCGDVFCEACCQYRKRLNSVCVPDPQGNIYRVCYLCSDLHTQVLGEIRNLTEEFFEHRMNKRVIIHHELRRLKKGFEKNVEVNSPLKNIVSETMFVMKVPDWQKSSKWLVSQEVEWCTKCSSKFTIFNVKHHCRVCGSVFCRLCCQNDLLLYYDENGKSSAKIIGIVGCPDEEPPVSLYIPLCKLCRDDLEEYQVQHYHLTVNQVDTEKGNLSQVGSILERLRTIEKKIDTDLPRFQEVVESRIFEQQYESISQGNNINDLAKLQGDISDFFTKYAVVIQGLKQYKLSSKTELKIMRNVISIKCSAYNDGMNLFKSLKLSLEKALPSEDFVKLQSYANTQAINNTYVTTRQLGLEALNFSTKYNFDKTIAERVSAVDSICFEELKSYIESTGDNWNTHLELLNALLKEQLITKKLVSPSDTLMKRDGAAYVQHFLLERSFTILYQVLRALNAKSSDGKFKASKEELQTLINDIGEIQIKQGGKGYNP